MIVDVSLLAVGVGARLADHDGTVPGVTGTCRVHVQLKPACDIALVKGLILFSQLQLPGGSSGGQPIQFTRRVTIGKAFLGPRKRSHLG